MDLVEQNDLVLKHAVCTGGLGYSSARPGNNLRYMLNKYLYTYIYIHIYIVARRYIFGGTSKVQVQPLILLRLCGLPEKLYSALKGGLSQSGSLARRSKL